MKSNYRYIFGVTNLPLTEDLRCGKFILSPLEKGQADLEKLTAMSSECEFAISAAGKLDIPGELSGQAVWDYIDEQKWGHVQLLLSFAHRRAIQMIDAQLIRNDGHKWTPAGVRSQSTWSGNPHGVSWYFWHADLQQFIDDCLPQLSARHEDGPSPLAQALNFFCTNYREDFVELQYLKTFIALEILFSSYGGDSRIISDNRFRSLIRKSLSALLKQAVSDESLSNEQREQIREKIPELNRVPAKHHAVKFLKQKFADYPDQQVTEDDLGLFITIRNQIAHTGRMGYQEAGREYHEVLYEQYMRLKSLVERVFLALLGQRPNLMEFTWKYIYMGA